MARLNNGLPLPGSSIQAAGIPYSSSDPRGFIAQNRLFDYGQGNAGPKFPAEQLAARIGSAYGARWRFLPWPDVDETPEMRAEYVRMVKSDDTVKAALLSKIKALALLPVQVHAPNKKNPRSRQVADFMAFNLEQMEGRTRAIVEEIFLHGMVNPFAICEKIYRLNDDGTKWQVPWDDSPWKGRHVLRCIKAREYATLEEDSFGNVTGIMGPGEQGGMVWHDPRDFVVYKHNPFFGRPMSELRAAYVWYYTKCNLRRFWQIAQEKFSTPYLKGEVPAGDTEAFKAMDAALAKMTQQTYAVIYANSGIDILDATSSPANFESAIKLCNESIMVSINGASLQSLTVSPQGGGGEIRGNASVQQGTTELFIDDLADRMADIYSCQIFPELTIENFGANVQPPYATLGATSDSDLTASLTIDQGLQGMGFEQDKNAIAERYSREEAKTDEDKLKNPQSQGAAALGGLGGMFGGGGSSQPPSSPDAGPAPIGADDVSGLFSDDTQDFADAESTDGKDVALSGKAGTAAESMLDQAVSAGTSTAYDISRQALDRLLQQGPDAVLAADKLFTPEETQAMADQIRDTKVAGDLLGRSRILEQADG